jgi:hypothetical protein
VAPARFTGPRGVRAESPHSSRDPSTLTHGSGRGGGAVLRRSWSSENRAVRCWPSACLALTSRAPRRATFPHFWASLGRGSSSRARREGRPDGDRGPGSFGGRRSPWEDWAPRPDAVRSVAPRPEPLRPEPLRPVAPRRAPSRPDAPRPDAPLPDAPRADPSPAGRRPGAAELRRGADERAVGVRDGRCPRVGSSCSSRPVPACRGGRALPSERRAVEPLGRALGAPLGAPGLLFALPDPVPRPCGEARRSGREDSGGTGGV